MNDELLKISLNQGRMFNTYKKGVSSNKKKFNIKEGFTNDVKEQEQIVRPSFAGYSPVLNNTQQRTTLINTVNQKDLDELTQLQSKYNNLIQEFTNLQKSIGDSSLNTINRVGSNNPYLGKNIRFTNDTICYVTYQGVAKPYANQNDYNNIVNKNGCPSKEYIELNIPWTTEYIKGAIIPTNPSLIVGSNMTVGESCGNEGSNVYASKLINNPSSTYVGCYNDKPRSTDINLVPVMNSSNNVNGFRAEASSVYMGNNEVGPWAAFDHNPNSFWHSTVDSSHSYNDATGVYEGSSGLNIVNVGRVNGEFLQINMPTTNSIHQYSLAPRLDLLSTRNPNSWYIIGLKDGQSYQVDRQTQQAFTSATPKTYDIPNSQAYNTYILLIDKVGNDNETYGRYCVQVAEWNLFSNSDSSFTNEDRAMINNPAGIGYTSFDNCKSYAIDNGYKYFGLQDYKSDGNAQCLVSNDIVRTKIYGDANSQLTLTPIWSTNTGNSNAKYAKLGNRGRLFLLDDAGSTIWQSSDKDLASCEIQYSFTDKSDASGDDMFHSSNITLDECKRICTDNPQCYGISMNSQSNNECWLKSQFRTIGPSNDRALYQKLAQPVCKFVLILQDDGNLCMYKGTPDNMIQPAVWCSMTYGKQSQPNVDWQASKSSLGRNYIIDGEMLAVDQWIGSNDGSYKLIMQSDGNFVLYTSTAKSGCMKKDDLYYGGAWVNSVYELGSAGNRNTLGKVGYVDADSKLKEYPDSMLGYSNDYQLYQNTDSMGNDIANLITDQNGCAIACNNNANCAAYVYQASSQTCWLKNNSAFPKGERQPNATVNLGVRKRTVKGSKTCSNKTVEIDTIQYDNYLKGDNMTQDTQCNQPIISKSDQLAYDNIKSQLIILGEDIASKMENLYNQDNKIYQKLNTNAEQFAKDLKKYKLTKFKINHELSSFKNLNNNNVEGMKNINDLNGMLSDSDLRVLQENYQYIMWSILAVGVLTITINAMKK